MSAYLYRLMGAMALDAGMYEGIEANRSITGQAALTVVLAAVAAGIGAAGWYGFRPVALVGISGLALLLWAAWAFLMFEIGSHVLAERDTQTDLGELLRTIGFAAAPGFLQVFAAMPAVAIPVVVLTDIWMFAAMVVAVRHALDYHSTARAIAVCALAAALCLVMAFVVGLIFTRTAA